MFATPLLVRTYLWRPHRGVRHEAPTPDKSAQRVDGKLKPSVELPDRPDEVGWLGLGRTAGALVGLTSETGRGEAIANLDYVSVEHLVLTADVLPLVPRSGIANVRKLPCSW